MVHGVIVRVYFVDVTTYTIDSSAVTSQYIDSVLWSGNLRFPVISLTAVWMAVVSGLVRVESDTRLWNSHLYSFADDGCYGP